MRKFAIIGLILLASCGLRSHKPPNGKPTAVEVFFHHNPDVVIKTLEGIIIVYIDASHINFYELNVESGGPHRVYQCQERYVGWRWKKNRRR